jgi:hypothetical protein
MKHRIFYLIFVCCCLQPAKDEDTKRNPFARTQVPFGGLINDIRIRYPKYISDITVNIQRDKDLSLFTGLKM